MAFSEDVKFIIDLLKYEVAHKRKNGLFDHTLPDIPLKRYSNLSGCSAGLNIL